MTIANVGSFIAIGLSVYVLVIRPHLASRGIVD